MDTIGGPLTDRERNVNSVLQRGRHPLIAFSLGLGNKAVNPSLRVAYRGIGHALDQKQIVNGSLERLGEDDACLPHGINGILADGFRGFRSGRVRDHQGPGATRSWGPAERLCEGVQRESLAGRFGRAAQA